MATWTWASATCRGTSHIRAGTSCQDLARCALLGSDRSVFGAIISDGAGSARFGRKGAAIICRTVVDRARSHFAATTDLPDDAIVWSWIYDARDLIELAAGRRESVPRQFAATLVAAFATNEETLVVHIGDGAAVFGFGDEWVCPSWPENGEYASTTYFVTDDPAPRLTITRMPKAVQSMAVFSDGMERLVLNYVNKCPHIPFFENIFRPIAGSKILGFDKILAVGLSNLLESAAVNDRTDDDKSLILAMRR